MRELIKVKDHPGLYRDPVSKAIVVNDPAARKNYQTQKLTISRSVGAVEELKEEINNMKHEMDDVKSMLKDIINHLKKSNQ